MSTATIKRPLAAAIADAEAFRALFPESCYASWTIAGSVRRRRAEISDVEHVVIPCQGEIDVPGTLFPEKKLVNLLWLRSDELLKAEHLTHHLYGDSPRWGEKMRGCDFRGMCHEIWTATADGHGSILAIRTGPGGYSRMLVTQLKAKGMWNNEGQVWDKRSIRCDCGWVGGMNAMEAIKFRAPLEGDKPRYQNGHGEALLCPQCGYGRHVQMDLVPVPTEEDYFECCGVKWIEPALRMDPPARLGACVSKRFGLHPFVLGYHARQFDLTWDEARADPDLARMFDGLVEVDRHQFDAGWKQCHDELRKERIEKLKDTLNELPNITLPPGGVE